MLDFDQIRQLIDIVCERKLGGLEIEETGFRLKIEGPEGARASAPAVVPVAQAPMAGAYPAVVPEATAPAQPEPAAASDGRHVVTAPIVGTYYSAPSPDADAYVRVGDQVTAGQVLCIVEAMKLMNEIEADVSGEVVEIFPQNAQPVEYGEPLFAIKPSG